MATPGTICLVAKDQAEKLGFLVSSHVVGAGTTQVFGQPSTAKRLAGRVTVNPLLNGRESDSAFAAPYTTRTDVQEKPIWAAENVAYSVTAFETSDNTPPDTPVAMQGAAQAGLSTGSIQYTEVTTRIGFEILYNQVLATYPSVDGDSGAPVFSDPGDDLNVTFYGINVGL